MGGFSYTDWDIFFRHLCERLQDGVRHVVLDHALGDEHLVEAAVLRPHRAQLGIHVGRAAGQTR